MPDKKVSWPLLQIRQVALLFKVPFQKICGEKSNQIPFLKTQESGQGKREGVHADAGAVHLFLEHFRIRREARQDGAITFNKP